MHSPILVKHRDIFNFYNVNTHLKNVFMYEYYTWKNCIYRYHVQLALTFDERTTEVCLDKDKKSDHEPELDNKTLTG
jgi:hypothetical protein